MQISWSSIRESCELAGCAILVIAAAGFMCFLQIFWLKTCIDGLHLPACLRQCPPPPRDLAAVRLIYQDDFRIGDRFCARCQLDFPKSLWDDEDNSDPWDF